MFPVFNFMNCLLRSLKTNPVIFFDELKQSISFPTKLQNKCQSIHEAPVLFKKMFHNSRINHTSYSTDACSEYRIWRNTSSDKRIAQVPGLLFKIVSLNILAQDLLIDHLSLYRNSKDKYLKWKYRLERLTEKIVEQRPDIICLQEVQESHLADIFISIKSQLPSMSYVFKNKTGSKPDGCAILYNSDIFELSLWDAVEFYRPDIELLDRHNIALIAKFRCKSDKKASFLVSTTHLLFNPKRQDVRLMQTVLLLAELDRHSIIQPGKLRRMPIILTGDFNFDSKSAPFELITTGKLCYENLAKKSITKLELETKDSQPIGKFFISEQLGITDNCQYIDCVKNNYNNDPPNIQNNDNIVKFCNLFSTGTLTHGLKLQSAYNHFDGIMYGSIFQGKWVTIDHLFYTKEDSEKPKHKKATLELISRYELPRVNQCYQIGPLPNKNNGSDHLMLAARFYLKFPIKSSHVENKT